MMQWYRQRLADGALLPDPAQEAAARALHEFGDALRRQRRGGGWKDRLERLFSGGAAAANGNAGGGKPARGIYLHGGVGRGKTVLMDGFFLQLPPETLPPEKKLRAHFHQFMRRLHEDMKARESSRDPLAQVAAALAERYDLICFDEFHVSDITDAMLLGRLLELLLAAGVRFVMTSNYAPAALYPNGLARDRFLPAIALLEKNLRAVALDGDEDYRRRLLSEQPVYFAPWAEEASREQMRQLFARLTGGIALQNDLRLGGRRLPLLARASDCVWFDFAVLCAQARAKSDYLQLAERYAAVFLSDVPRLDNPDIADAARRFTWLVDILYDEQVRLIIGAAAPLAQLYGGGEGGESGRTLSRLIEMQSPKFGGQRKDAAAAEPPRQAASA